MKKINLLNVSLLNSYEMNEIIGSGVECRPSNCKNDVHTSVNNCLENMRVNNPPIQSGKDDTPPVKHLENEA